ncbi:2-dehydropantoate 2-reductase [Rheinheimera riviphila]|uniref:2-dehydropantoate 2-reductase n=1 Tax=Rheinheimera riviphila TaxID=1834037 RepID=A0A437QRS8_9GAMM|nr:2-dehydropantoate 2-reductase [Rheinheimera riviphila]RVU37208.1 2-dehydropantoate 2-reductase [Rheinheimera riviphila]
MEQHRSEVSTGISQKPWLVVGRGAIGLLAASRWALAQQPVQLWLRQAQSLNYRFSVGSRDFPMQLAGATHGPFDKVLIPVKAFDTVAAVQQLLPHLSEHAHIVLCHNGMGTLEQVQALLLPSQGLWFASTTQGAYKPSPLQVRHTGFGETMLGACNAAARSSVTTIASDLNIALGPLQQVADITPYLWKKLAINCVINPLTALLQVRNGELLKAEYQVQISQLLTEFVLVAKACGQQFSLDELQQLIEKVQQTTAQNLSSMQQDVANQRRTELNAITGFLLQQAAAHQIQLPAHLALYQQLTARLQPWQY